MIEKRIAIVGLGYVGLPLAVEFGKIRKVLGFDINKNRILELKNGSDSSAVVVEHYGDILYKLGEVNEAIIQWKKAKELGDASDFLIQKIEEGKLYE